MVKLSSVTVPWGLEQRHKLAEILNCTDLVTITGTDIIISSCLGLRLATPVINREQKLNDRRVKRKGKEKELEGDFQRRQKTQIQVAAKQEACKNYKGIATQKKMYN